MQAVSARTVFGRLAIVIATSQSEGAQSAGPGVVVGSPGDRTATLSWIAPSDQRVRGYRVYVGSASRSYVLPKGAGLDAGATTTYRVEYLNVGKTYYFAVTAYDEAGNESDYSNEAAKSIR
jgi:hypothetical protein